MGDFRVGPEDVEFDYAGRIVIKHEALAALLRETLEQEPSQASVTIDLHCPVTDVHCVDPPTNHLCTCNPGQNILCGCTFPMGSNRCT